MTRIGPQHPLASKKPQDLFCANTLQCDDGAVGTACQGEGDCAEGLLCESFQCASGA